MRNETIFISLFIYSFALIIGTIYFYKVTVLNVNGDSNAVFHVKNNHDQIQENKPFFTDKALQQAKSNVKNNPNFPFSNKKGQIPLSGGKTQNKREILQQKETETTKQFYKQEDVENLQNRILQLIKENPEEENRSYSFSSSQNKQNPKYSSSIDHNSKKNQQISDLSSNHVFSSHQYLNYQQQKPQEKYFTNPNMYQPQNPGCNTCCDKPQAVKTETQPNSQHSTERKDIDINDKSETRLNLNSREKTDGTNIIDREDVSLVIQSDMSDFRLARIEKNLQRWSGPVTIALIQYPENVDWQQRHHIQQRFYRPNVKTTFYETQKDMKEHYPFNIMRNVALSISETKYFLLIDADLIVSHGLYEHVKSEQVRKLVQYKILYIIPPFDVRISEEEFDKIKNKKDLLKAKYENPEGTIEEFHRKSQVHKFIDYEKWEQVNSAYQIWPLINKDPEPYGVFLRTVPRYDEGFVGKGKDRQSHFWMMKVLGYQPVVCPWHFLSHLPHSYSSKKSSMPDINTTRFKYLKRKFYNALISGTTHY